MPRPAKPNETVYYVTAPAFDGMSQETCSPYFSSESLADTFLKTTISEEERKVWPYSVTSKTIKIPFVYETVADAIESTSPLGRDIAALKDKYGVEFDKFLRSELDKLDRERKAYSSDNFS